MKTDIYTTPAVFDLLAHEWNPLLEHSTTNTLFLTREWQKVWWQGLGEGELRVLTMRDEAGHLIGIAPLFFSSGEISGAEVAFVGCREVSDYLDFIFARGSEPACLQALLDYLAGPACLPWREIGLCNIPETSPTLTLLPPLAQALGWQVETRFEDVCPIVQLPASFEDYLALLDGKERRELVRKLRRAGEEVHLVFAREAVTLDRDMDDFIRLMKASMPSKAAFMTPRMERFFRLAARAMFDAGWLELSFLEVNGERAATYLNFVYDNAVLVYNSGLDPYKYAYLSPGQVLLGRLIEKAIHDGRRAFDFLQGNEEYKYQFGGKDLKLYTMYISR
ncbi:MAG: GNAT family N-acetyltransferase [Anaerolineae bacterium]|nr:GNAT family N-acetyltransferase [Thermoflexales bacterium]MDW8406216.1 GNAT family N-acetyltransferase [Anaerolineae bacterium]